MAAHRPQPRLPSFTIVVETANLQSADHDRLMASLDSIAAQLPAPPKAGDVVLLDSGEGPPALFRQVLVRHPWISIKRIANGIDYGDQKSISASSASGEIVIFADSDCLYEPGWLASYLETFAARPEIGILAGETAVAISGPFTLAMALVFFFPRFSFESEVRPARGFYGNNVAFRRTVLERCPFPSGLPIYRGQNIVYSRMLHEAGISIWRHPRARSVHSPPEGFWPAVKRLYLTGRDTPRLARLSSPPLEAPFLGDFEPYQRGGGRVRKVAGRIRDIARQQPGYLLLLPLAVPMAACCVASFFIGLAWERLSPSAHRSSRSTTAVAEESVAPGEPAGRA